MASTLFSKLACNPADDAALGPKPRRGLRQTAFTCGVQTLVVFLMLAPSAMILATGCGGPALMPTPNLYTLTPDNPFTDVPPPLRTNTLDILYATDRAPTGDPAKDPLYGIERSKSLAFGTARVRIGKEDLSWDDLVTASRSAQRPASLSMRLVETREVGRFPPVPTPQVERDGHLVESPESVDARLAAETRFKALVADRLALTPKKEVYIFIHGTGSDFKEAACVMAGLWHFMGRSGVPMLYTWPAGGGGDTMLGYPYDRESSEFTVYHLKQFLRLVASCPGVEKVHILAHSRGCDTALAALRELNIEILASGGDTRKVLKIGCLVLAAADLDQEVSTQRVGAEHLMRVPEQMVLYISPTDARLRLADLLFGSKDRLGQAPASTLILRRNELLRNLPDIQFIDARIAGSTFGSHNYFYSHPAVSSDLILLLRDNRRPGAENGRPLTSEAVGLWRIDPDYPAPTQGQRAAP
jgi:esterase/lipase superfamily enzyme